MKNKSKFGFIPIASGLQEHKENEIVEKYSKLFKNLGGEKWDETDINRVQPLVFFVITGGTEQKILNLLERREVYRHYEYVIIIAHPGYNSLPAAIELLSYLHQDNKKGEIIYLTGTQDEKGIQKIEAALEEDITYKKLQRSKIGLIGSPSDWLIASKPETGQIIEVWGPESHYLDLSRLISKIENIDNKVTEKITHEIYNSSVDIVEPDEDDIKNSVKTYLALKDICVQEELDAVTVRCYDLIKKENITACYAFARLNQEGIIAACEGDLVSAVGMLWIKRLLRQCSWMANISRINIEKNSICLAHCTVSFNMIDNYSLRSHFESDLAVGIQGNLKPQPVTLVRIGGKDMKKLWVAKGDIIVINHEDNLCRTQVEVNLIGDKVTELLQEPLGNHILLTLGHHKKTILQWWHKYIE